ncbi:MAG: HEAT repeat domain-containing protein, partial [Bdellovibrionales bacterium]|nr:HEAT repeat domain-containing protein [Bdellovibrionales bacterium]
KMFQTKDVLTQNELKSIKQDLVECEKPERLLLDFVDMVLAVLMEEQDQETFLGFIDYLGQALENTLMQNHLYLSRILMELVRKFPIKPIPILNSHPTFMAQILERLWTPQRIQMLFLSISHAQESDYENIETLVQLTYPGAIEQALQLIESFDDKNKVKIILRGLAKLSPSELLDQITPWFSSKDPEIIRLGIYVLSLTQQDNIIDIVKKLLQNDSPSIKKEGLMLLKNCPGSQSRELLVNLLSDSDTDVRVFALRLLGVIGDKAIVKKLGEAILSKTFHEKSLNERKHYFVTVAKIAGDDFLPFLENIFETKNWFGNQTLSELCLCAAFALSSIKTEKSKEMLARLSKTGNKATRHAIEVITKSSLETRAS